MYLTVRDPGACLAGAVRVSSSMADTTLFHRIQSVSQVMIYTLHFQPGSTPFFLFFSSFFIFFLFFFFFNQVLFPVSSRFYFTFQSGHSTPFSIRFYSLFNQVLLPFQSGSTPFSFRFDPPFNHVLLPFLSGSTLLSNQVLLPL